MDSDEEAIKAYWKVHYVGEFDKILDALNDKPNSPLMQIFVEIENVLLNAIIAPDTPLVITLMNRNYGDESGESGKLNASLEGITISHLKVELVYLREQWKNSKGDEDPKSFQDIVHMVQTSFEDTNTLRH